ncbi:Fe(3+)-hydroxamate ABC transporter permease FhuB [soil metagenome]
MSRRNRRGLGPAMVPARGRSIVGHLIVFSGGPLLLLTLLLLHVSQGQSDVSFGAVIDAIISPSGTTTDNVVRYIRLPRAAIGVLAGAALGMAGVLMQSVTRNPLASPGTIGVNAGAYLAIVAATIFAPGLAGASPVTLAFAGGAAAAALAYVIAGTTQVTPVRLALAGIAVALVCSALTAMLQLFNENETAGLFFWGAGSLAENDWSGTQYAWPRVLAGAAVAFIIARPLDVLLLGDDVARSLGQRVTLTRFGGIVIGVFLAAVAVSVVGPIGFVGLIVPHVVRLLGVKGHRLLLPATAIWGAIVLIGADIVARLVTTNISELPAGGITALIGAPFFVWLARRAALPGGGGGGRSTGERFLKTSSRRRVSYPVLMGISFIVLATALIAGVALGDLSFNATTTLNTLRGEGTTLSERVILDLRLPRLLVALQGVVRNPLAGPEIVGITGGAGLGALTVIVLFPGLPFALVPIAAFVGAFAAFAVVYLASWKDGLTPTRLALIGVAVSAFCAAGINILVVKAQVRVASALVWLSGSTYARDWDDLQRLLPWLVVLLPVAWLAARQLDVLGLGDDAARAIGMPLERTRLAILTVAVALSAAAVSVVGTIGFVGLIGPHTARILLAGQHQHRKLVPLAAILGALLVTLADTIGRFALAPRRSRPAWLPP